MLFLNLVSGVVIVSGLRKMEKAILKTSQKAMRGVELLEARNLLSATADIIYILDESASQEFSGLREWVEDVSVALEDKLVARGIGHNDPMHPLANRYGLIKFGGEYGGDFSVPVTLQNANLFGSLQDVLAEFANFADSGANEDGWDAVGRGLGIIDAMVEYVFRPEAAVHLVLVGDEPRDVDDANFGLEFFNILDAMQSENLTTTTPGLGVLNDAVLTAVSPTDYSNSFGGIESDNRIFGIDPHIMDNVNIDLNSLNPGDDVSSPDVADQFVFFEFDDTGASALLANQTVGIGAADVFIDTPPGYQAVRSAFANPCLVNCLPTEYNPNMGLDNQVVGQDRWNSEVYTFLAWESRGTAWDFHVVLDNFDVPTGTFPGLSNPLSEISLFNRAFVDDTFEKLKLQIADFNKDGRITGTDIDQMLSFHYNPGMPQTDQDKAIYDFDNDNNIGVQDAVKLIDDVFKLWVGDANADGVFNQADIIQVLQAGRYLNGPPATWSQGDWAYVFDDESTPPLNQLGPPFDNEFDQADILAVFLNPAGLGYLVGYRPEMLPVWGEFASMTDQVNGLVYFPEWTDFEANAPASSLENVFSVALRGQRFSHSLAASWAQAIHELDKWYPVWRQGSANGNGGHGNGRR